MLGKLILLLIILPAVELYILLELGASIGVLNTVLIIVATGLIGTGLYKSQSYINLTKMYHATQKGWVPDIELFDHLLIIIGAVLLMSPGIITDTAGLLLLLPPTRPLIRELVKRKIKKSMNGKVEVQTYSPS